MRVKKTELNDLIRMMKSLEDHLARCSRCGMCQAVCPLYMATGHEKDVARGKLMLLDGFMKELFENPDGVADRLDHCLLCGSCEAECPRNVSVLEIVLTARSIITEYKGLSLSKKILFQRIMENPNSFNRMFEWGARLQYLFVKPSGVQPGASCSNLVSPLLTNRNIVPLASIPFHKTNLVLDHPEKTKRVKVAFFVGCLLDKLFPETAKAIVEVLTYHGVEVFIPQPQGCCGIPMLSGGDRKTFNHLVSHHVRLFESKQFDFLVTGCATCTATIKKIWPAMAETDTALDKEGVIHMAEKTHDISEFLVNILEVSTHNEGRENDAEKIPITYHDPCHLKKTLKIYKEPRILIKDNSKYAFKEMPDADACCGMGGSFNLNYYETSTEIGLKKLKSVKESGASIVVTGCPACMIQLKDIFEKTKTPVEVKHVIEIYPKMHIGKNKRLS